MRSFSFFLFGGLVVLAVWCGTLLLSPTYEVWHQDFGLTALNKPPVDHLEVALDKDPLCDLRDGLPDPLCTPGVLNPDITQENIKDTICNPKKWTTDLIRPPVSYTNTLKIKQIKEYGYSDTIPSHYEEDHAWPLSLGGHPTDPKNLFPQPYHLNIDGDDVGAYSKDKVETRLHSLVCKGTLTLKEAQDAIRMDWIAAFRKFIGPLPKYN